MRNNDDVLDELYRLRDDLKQCREYELLEYIGYPSSVEEDQVLAVENLCIITADIAAQLRQSTTNECEYVALAGLIPNRNNYAVLCSVVGVAREIEKTDRSVRTQAEAVERALELYAPWFILSNRLLSRIENPPPRDKMQAFENAVDAFDQFLAQARRNTRSANSRFGTRSDDRRESRFGSSRNSRDTGRRTLLSADTRGLGSVTRSIRDNGGFGGNSSRYQQQRQEPDVRQVQQEQRPMQTQMQKQPMLLTATTFSATAAVPHPPFYYAGPLAPFYNTEGKVEFMPFSIASLALPPEDGNTSVALRLGGGESSGGIKMPPVGAHKRFTGTITEQPPSNTIITGYVANVLKQAECPKDTYLSRIGFDLEVGPVPDAAYEPFLEEIYSSSLDLLGMANLMKAAFYGKAQKRCAISTDTYWMLNAVMTTAFNFISEVMYGIDPYAVVRIGTFGPTGRDCDNDDVGCYLQLIEKHYGKTFYDNLQQTMPSLLRRVALPCGVNVNDSVKEYREKNAIADDVVLHPTRLRRDVYISAMEVIDDLKAVAWKPSSDGAPSPGGFAPCVISEGATPMLYDLAQAVMATHTRSNAAYAVINFGVGAITVTNSAVSGALIGKWSSFS